MKTLPFPPVSGARKRTGFSAAKRTLTRFSLLISSFFIAQTIQAQCSISVPVGTDGCHYGPGTVSLSASGSTGFYNWYASPTAAAPFSFGSTYDTPLLNSSQTYYVAAADTGVGITLDRDSSEYAAIDNLTYSGTGHTALTVETWVKTSSGADQVIASFDRSEFWRLEINGSGAGFGQIGFDLHTPNGIEDFGSNSRVDDGKWHHVAGVFDNGTASIYIDGVLDATTAMGSTFGQASTTRYGFIGVGSETSTYNGPIGPTSYFNGQMDDLRIWNTARTASQIADNRFACLTGTETGLVAFYKMNENSGIILADSSSTGATATLFNVDSNVVWNEPGLGICECESSRIPVVATIGQNNLSDQKLTCAQPSFTLDAGAGYASYLWNNGETTQTVQANGSGIYQVTVTGGACAGSDRASVVGERDADRLLRFDGSNDYVAIENYTYAGTVTEFTIETWLRTSNSGSQVIASYDRSEYWRLEIDGEGGGPGQIGFDVNTNVGIIDFGSNARIDDNEWHHVAGVFDNGQISIYIDGILDADTNAGTTCGSGVTRYGFLGTGSEAETFNGSRGPNSYFNGRLDETRVWSVARTATQIRNSMTTHIPGTATGLETCLKFDDPQGTRVFDYSTENANDGRLFNFTNTGRPPSGAPIGDKSTIVYTNSWGGQTVAVSSCEGETLIVSNMSGAPDGVHVYFVNRPPDSTAGINGLGTNNRYFGVHKIGDDTATYTATYHYMGNPHLGSVAEQDIRMFTRNDNSITNWNTSAATLDTSANTFSASAQFTEFILGTVSSTTLPIELIAFDAKPENEEVVHVDWETAVEINNDFFTIERSKDGTNWEEVTQIMGAGNSSKVLTYSEVDEMPFRGLSYYRLKQTDFDGEFTYSPVRAVRLAETDEPNQVRVFPNPTTGLFTLESSADELEGIRVFSAVGVDVTGRVRIQLQGPNQAQIDLTNLNTGLYFVRSGTSTARVKKL